MLLKQQVRQGRPYVVIYTEDGLKATKKVHRMVAEEFVPNPEGKPEVAHWNGKTMDNRQPNLRWATHIENEMDKHRHGTRGRKLTWEDAKEIRSLYTAGGFTHHSLAAKFGVGKSIIHSIVSNQKWKEPNSLVLSSGKDALLERIT